MLIGDKISMSRYTISYSVVRYVFGRWSCMVLLAPYVELANGTTLVLCFPVVIPSGLGPVTSVTW